MGRSCWITWHNIGDSLVQTEGGIPPEVDIQGEVPRDRGDEILDKWECVEVGGEEPEDKENWGKEVSYATQDNSNGPANRSGVQRL